MSKYMYLTQFIPKLRKPSILCDKFIIDCNPGKAKSKLFGEKVQ